MRWEFPLKSEAEEHRSSFRIHGMIFGLIWTGVGNPIAEGNGTGERYALASGYFQEMLATKFNNLAFFEKVSDG